MEECDVDGCYELALPDGELCEEHEIASYEDAWPDFHDEHNEGFGYWDTQDEWEPSR